MFQNYLKVALRNFGKYKIYSAINVIGLAMGMACCVLILLFVQDELRYDRHHEKAERIFRVEMTRMADGKMAEKASVAYPAGPTLAETFPEVQEAARLYKAFQSNPTIRYGDVLYYEEDFFFADSTIFHVFDFEFISGNPHQALNQPNTMVISENLAQKYFANPDAPDGYDDPLGKILHLNIWSLDDVPFKITGVCKTWPKTSHFQWGLLVTFENYHESTQFSENAVSWFWDHFWTYVVLPSSGSAAALSQKLPQFVAQNYPEQIRDGVQLSLQPLTDIHLHSNRIYEIAANSNIKYVYIFATIAIAILLLACINFVNLSTARAAKRAREIGMRKVLGARRQQLIRQFMSEAVLTCLAALAICLVLVEVSLPLFNDISGKSLTLNESGSLNITLILAAFTFLVSMLAGSYPALFMSGFQPAKALKGNANSSASGRSTLRMGLVIIQFSITIILLIGTLIIRDQLSFLRNKNLGFNKDQIVTVPIRGTNAQANFEAFRHTLKQHPSVVEVTHLGYILGETIPAEAVLPEGMQLAEPHRMPRLSVDFGFLKTFDIELLAGRDFSEAFSTDRSEAAILNESAMRQIGWSLDDPENSPIGKQVELGDRRRRTYTVVGVVKDFHHASLHQPLTPLVLRMMFRYPGFIAAKLNAADVDGGMAHIRDKWQESDPNQSLVYSFADEEFDKHYKAEDRLSSVIGYFSIFAILIACLGLFGLTAFTAEQRTKEIGIRKVLGASVMGIILLISKSFLKLVLLANFIAWPLAYFMMNEWLTNFAYHIDIGMTVFLASGILAILIAVLTIGYQAVKAALANPVTSLRYE